VPTSQSGPLSWRDVYTAVNASKDDIIKHIDDAVTPIRTTQLDHEARLRMIEQGQTPWQMASTATGAKQGERIGLVEQAIKGFKDREGGVFMTLKGGQTLILFIAVIASFFLSLWASLHAGTPVVVNAP